MNRLGGLGAFLGTLAFLGFAAAGTAGWIARARNAPVRPADSGVRDAPGRVTLATDDEVALALGHFQGHDLWRQVQQGWPWRELAQDLERARTDLPDDPVGSTQAIGSRIEETLEERRFRYAQRSATLNDVIARLQYELSPLGVNVYTREPLPPSGFVFDVPDRIWNTMELTRFLDDTTGRMIRAGLTTEGLCLGTEDACSRAWNEEKLFSARRRVATEHDAPELSVPYRPNFADASIVSVARDIQAQTGIEVVVDIRIWEKVPGFRWRRDPIALRVALDRLAGKLDAFWRFRDGRVWLLLP